MSTSKYLGRLAAVAMAAAVLLVTLLAVCPEKIGVTDAGSAAVSYADLFDPFSVMEIEISVDEDDWQEMLDNALAEEYISCDLTVNGTTYYNVGVRPKGNTSLTTVASSDSDRFSFKFEMDHYVDGQTCEGLDKFVVNNIQSDATWMKEYLSYQLLTQIGVPSPLYCYAHITVNGEEWGLYLAIEALEDSFAERVYGLDHGQLYKVEGSVGGGGMDRGEAGELPEGMAAPEGGVPGGEMQLPAEGEIPGAAENADENTDAMQTPPDFADREDFAGNRGGMGGMSGSGGDLVYTDDDESSYSAIFDNSVFDSTSTDRQRVIEALRALSEGENLEQYINVDEVLRYIAANAVLVNLDSYFGTMEHNYYLYEEDGQLSILPWDYNLSFAGFQSGSAESAVNFPIDTPVSGVSMEDRPLISQLLSVPEYQEQYHAYLQEILDEYFNSGLFLSTIRTIDNLISPYIQNDPTAFYTYEEYQAGVEALKEFGLLRAQSIEGQLNGTIPSTTEGQEADPSALIDAGDLSLTAMGTQGGGGMGGMERGEMTFPEETPSQDGDTSSEAESGAEQAAGMFMGRGGNRGGFGGMGGGMAAPGMPDAMSAGSGNTLLLVVTFAGAGLCVLLAVLWPRRRMLRGQGKEK